jgi:hypothetical protein
MAFGRKTLVTAVLAGAVAAGGGAALGSTHGNAASNPAKTPKGMHSPMNVKVHHADGHDCPLSRGFSSADL